MPQKQTKISYKPFGKKFLKILSASVLSVVLVYGGIVWATGNSCDLYQNSSTGATATGNTWSSLPSGWSFLRKVCARVNPNTFVISTVKNESNEAIGDLKITNNSTDKDYFVPLKHDRERNSFLNSAKNGYLSTDIEVCEEGGDGSSFGNGVAGCTDGSCVANTSCNSDSDCGSGGTCFGVGGSCSGSYSSGNGANCSGTPSGSTELDWNGNTYDWEYGYVYFLNTSGNVQIASICGADAEVGDSIGSGTGSYPNNSNQCIIQVDPLNGTYYQVHQFSPGVNYWFALTTVSSQVTAVNQMAQFALGSNSQTCNGGNQPTCESVAGCTWNSANQTSCGGASNQTACEIQNSNCTWNTSTGGSCFCDTVNTTSWCGDTVDTCKSPYIASTVTLSGGGVYEWYCSASGNALPTELVAICTERLVIGGGNTGGGNSGGGSCGDACISNSQCQSGIFCYSGQCDMYDTNNNGIPDDIDGIC